MGLKGFVGIWTGSCCMTNKQRERWAAEQMQLTHLPLQMHSEIWGDLVVKYKKAHWCRLDSHWKNQIHLVAS